MEGVEKRGLFVFGILVLFIIMFTGFSEAAVTCIFPNQTILRLSDVTNAHGEVYNGAGNYDEEICYDTIFGVLGSGDRSCGTNDIYKIVGLSGLTNAHAEEPSLSDYGTNVCYSGLSCTARTGACLSGESLVLSLSSSTNAHLASDSSYSQNICCTAAAGPVHAECVSDACTVVPGAGDDTCAIIDGADSCDVPGDEHSICSNQMCEIVSGSGTNECSSDSECVGIISCSITSASWSVTEAVEGTSVNLIVEGTDCDEEPVDFFIAEADCVGDCNYGDIDTDDTNKLSVNSVSGSFSGTQAVVSWIAEWHLDENNFPGDDDPEYFFKAELSSNPSVSIDESGELKVTPVPLDYCDKPVIICGQYYTYVGGNPTAENACNEDLCDVAENSVGIIQEDPSFCDDEDINCFCEWDATDLKCGTVWEEIETPECGNGIKEGGELCDGDDLGDLSCTNVDMENGVLKCYPSGHVDECTFDTNSCVGPPGECDGGIVNPGENCDGEPLLLGCANLNNYDSGELACYPPEHIKGCKFDLSDCREDDPPTVIGKCVYTSATTGSCDTDSFLTSSWTATWIGDPSSREASCKSDSTIIECPAQIQLAFFNLYNMLITLLAIAGIYGIISLRKKS